jgi:chemotaxis protein MotB
VQRRTYGSDEGWLLSYADLITNLLVFFAIIVTASDISRTQMQQIAEKISGVEQPASLSSIQKEIDAQIEREGLQDVIRTDLTDEGLKVSLDSGVVFDSGSAKIRPEHEQTLNSMLKTLAPYGGRYDFAVEGHTDSTPILGGGVHATNWELSTGRANAVRSRLETAGVDSRRSRVEGYADTIELSEKNIEGLSEDQRLARHRRVVVRIY